MEVFAVGFDENIEMCGELVVHEDTLENIRANMLKDHIVNDLAEFFKLFGDATRLRILYALSLSEMCVCDISEFLDMSQSAVSHQLKVLRQCRLVKYRREGRNVFYSLDDEHIQQIIHIGLEHMNERQADGY
ncbi:MAG: winged helix-turn-helix transcriptional regulator [Clostridiales bacterium]|nr:winged helix-turn-helix transcriptional regulator [Clostridiales bacterium]